MASATLAPRDLTFEEHRGLLFGVAYRMLGSVVEAEDTVQEAYLRFRGSETRPANPRAFLVTIVTRLCLDLLKSARVQRETYIGPWLPEPLVNRAATAPTPEEAVAAEDTVSFAFLVMLEELGPVERAVFLLREVFDYDYGDIADVVQKSEAACRQVFHRARARLAERHHRHSPDYAHRRDLTARFLAAAHEGNMAGLLEILSADVIAYSDGGGKAAAAINPIFGADRVARFILGVARKNPTAVEFVEVNGDPGVILRTRSGRIDSILVLEIEEGLATALYVVRNPDKLAGVGR